MLKNRNRVSVNSASNTIGLENRRVYAIVYYSPFCSASTKYCSPWYRCTVGRRTKSLAGQLSWQLGRTTASRWCWVGSRTPAPRPSSWHEHSTEIYQKKSSSKKFAVYQSTAETKKLNQARCSMAGVKYDELGQSLFFAAIHPKHQREQTRVKISLLMQGEYFRSLLY